MKWTFLLSSGLQFAAPTCAGYKYIQYSCVLGNLLELTDKDLLIKIVKDNLMVQLDKNKLYALLVNIYYSKEGKLNGISPMKSKIVTVIISNYMVNLIAVIIINGWNKVIILLIWIVIKLLLVLSGEIAVG